MSEALRFGSRLRSDEGLLNRAGDDVTPVTRTNLARRLRAAGRTEAQARWETEILARFASLQARVIGQNPNRLIRDTFRFMKGSQAGADGALESGSEPPLNAEMLSGVEDMAGDFYFQSALAEVQDAGEALARDAAAWSKTVDGFLEGTLTPRRRVTLISRTPLVLQMLGAKNLPVLTSHNVIEKVLADKAQREDGHNLPPEILKQIPAAMTDPLMVFKSASQSGSLVLMLDLKDQHGATVIVPVALDEQIGRGYTVNFVTSVYGKKRENTLRPNNEWFGKQILDGNLLYINEKKSREWRRTAGLQLPGVGTFIHGAHRIPNEDDLVKLREAKPTLYQAHPPGAFRGGVQFPDDGTIHFQPALEEVQDAETRRKFGAAPAAEITGEEIIAQGEPRPAKKILCQNLIDWINGKGWFDRSFDNDDTGWGDIRLSRNSVRDVLAHGAGRGKTRLFAAVPEMIKTGIHLEEQPHGDNGEKRHIFAAKVKIAGEEFAVGFVIHEDRHGHKYYDHELTEMENLGATVVRTQNETGLNRPPRDSVMNIVQKHLGVKPEMTLYQAHPPGAFRGGVQFLDDGTIHIVFGRGRDASTAAHEFAHAFREMVGRTLSLPPEQIADQLDFDRLKAGWAAAEAWLARFNDEAALAAEYEKYGAAWGFGGQALGALTAEERARVKQTAQHEYFARGFERYLLEGRAPAAGLRKLFADMKKWLLDIYRIARGLDVELTSEVRRFFDQLLATEEELALEGGRMETEKDGQREVPLSGRDGAGMGLAATGRGVKTLSRPRAARFTEEEVMSENELMGVEGKNKTADFAAQVVAMLEAGTAPWQKPWKAGALRAPQNPISGTVYRGVNRLMLAAGSLEDPRWMTLKQANEAGYRVKSGSRAKLVEFWQTRARVPLTDERGEQVLDEEGRPRLTEVKLDRPRVRRYPVFHVSQLQDRDGRDYPAQEAGKPREWEILEEAEAILGKSGARILHDQTDSAYYAVNKDEIHLPPRNQFSEAGAYYATALHELGHWTRHYTRMDRKSGVFGTQEYAREELRAEISSWMLAQEMGLPFDPGNHAAYVQDWIEVIREDPYELHRACRDAEKIKDYILGLGQERERGLGGFAPGASEDQGLDVASLAGSAGLPRPALDKVALRVPYADKDLAKRAGARWDREVKLWFAPAGTDLIPLARWIPRRAPEPVPTMSPEDEFRMSLENLGLKLDGPPVMDGTIHRTPVEGGKPGSRDGAYSGHLDGHPNGWGMNYKTGDKINWIRIGQAMTPERKAVLKEEAAERRAEKERIRERGWLEAARRADEKLNQGVYLLDGDREHPYLQAKGVAAHGFLARDGQGRLLVPGFDLDISPVVVSQTGVEMVTLEPKIQTLQTIRPDGGKVFESGTKKAGAMFLIDLVKFNELAASQRRPDAPEAEILIAEGYATGASLYEATGKPVAVAFDAGNLKAVAESLRRKFPKAALTLCADNDHSKAKNVGLERAGEAAEAVGGRVLAPEFTNEEKARGLTDFNDLHQARGLEAIGEVFALARGQGGAEKPGPGTSMMKEALENIRRAAEDAGLFR